MKNKKSLKLAASVVLSVVFAFPLSSCGPDEPIYRQVRQEHKDWGAFKEGTWWVYEEENLGIRDSIYIFRYQAQFNKTEVTNHREESILSYFSSSLNVNEGVFGVAYASSGVQMGALAQNGGEHILRCYLVVPPPVQGDWIRTGSPTQHTIFDTIYPALQIRDNEFTNVVRANNNMNLFYNGTPTLIYSAKNIGIVRKEFPEYNQVWNLVKYNIVQ